MDFEKGVLVMNGGGIIKRFWRNEIRKTRNLVRHGKRFIICGKMTGGCWRWWA